MTQAPTTAPSDDQIIAAALEAHGDQGVWWVVKRIQAGSRSEQIVMGTPARFYGADFDEHAYAATAGPGEYIRRLKVLGQTKTFDEVRFSVGQVLTGQGTISVPGAGAPAPATPAGDPMLAEILRELRAAREAKPAAPDPNLGVVQQVVGLISALGPILKPPPVSPLRDYMEGLQLIEQLRGDKAAPAAQEFKPMEIVQALREGMPLLKELIASKKAPPPARQLQPNTAPQLPKPAAPVLRESGGGSDPAPSASQSAPAEPSHLDAVAALLLIAGKRPDVDPLMYVDVIADTFAGVGVDVYELARESKAGELTAGLIERRPDLEPVRLFLAKVEDEIRETAQEQADQTEHDADRAAERQERATPEELNP